MFGSTVKDEILLLFDAVLAALECVVTDSNFWVECLVGIVGTVGTGFEAFVCGESDTDVLLSLLDCVPDVTGAIDTDVETDDSYFPLAV